VTPAAKKAPVKKAPVKKAPVKKAPVKKAPVKKAPVKKAPVKKAPLGEYRSKRDFSLTPEPKGEETPGGRTGRRFVVQRHRARRLHYDFRLEVDGVLASWAMPKGPSLDPSVRSLAVHVEDHPIEYRDFEGVIPGGQYGAGDVIVWDRGTWELHKVDDPTDAIAEGEVHFELDGEKLSGRFVLVRTRSDQRGQEQWLMLHKKDNHAQPGWRTEDHPRSVKSGRTNEEVAAHPDAMWRSHLPAEKAEIRVEREPERKPTEPVTGPTKPVAGPTDAEITALDSLGDDGVWELQGRELKLTNLNKVLFPAREDEGPMTKRDLVRYYVEMAPTIVPYLIDRPVNMHRFPNGVDRSGFWHKAVPTHAPDWLRRWRYELARPGDTEIYAVIDGAPALAWMANFAAVELHAWTSEVEDVRQPTWALIDIDPGTKTSFEDVVLLTQIFRAGLDHLGVFGMPKLTGRRGVHIWIPIVRGYSFDETRTWVEKLSRAVGATVPELVSWTWEKSARKGLARLDFTQNAINKTLAAPYSVRAAPGAPVSVPVEWDELDSPDLRSDSFTLRTVPARIAEVGDPFERLLGRAQRLPEL